MTSNDHEVPCGSRSQVQSGANTSNGQAAAVREEQNDWNFEGGHFRTANFGTHHHTRNETIQAQQANFHVETFHVTHMVNESSHGNTPLQTESSADVVQLSDTIRMFTLRKLSRSPTSSIFYGQKTSRVIGSKDLAIKLLPHNDKTRKEAEILTKLTPHDHVVSIIHSDLCKHFPIPSLYIAMELCHTQNLHDYIFGNKRENIPFDPQLSILQANQIVNGLEYIHSKNIIHRDLKPHNVLFSHDRRVLKIADFGISKPMTHGCSITNVSNAQAGTDGYRAPETYNTNEISKRADIFSLGLVIYFVWSYGFHPYGDDIDLWNYNIKTNRNCDLNLLLVPNIESAKDLLEWMLSFIQRQRPSAQQVLSHEYFGRLETQPKRTFTPQSGVSTPSASRHTCSFHSSHQENTRSEERPHSIHHVSTYPTMSNQQTSPVCLPPPPENPRSNQRTWPRTGRSRYSNLIEFEQETAPTDPDNQWYLEQQGTWPRSRKSTSSRGPVEHQEGLYSHWLAQQQRQQFGGVGLQQPVNFSYMPNLTYNALNQRTPVQHSASFGASGQVWRRQQQPTGNHSYRQPGQQNGRPSGENSSSPRPAANAIIVFDQQTSLLQAKNVCNSRWKNIQSISDDLLKQRFTAVLVDRSIYVLLWNRHVYSLDYTHTNASWRSARKMICDHGMRPPADVLNGFIYVAGATGQEKLGCRFVERYNVSKSKWEQVGSMENPRTDHSVLAANGCLYAIGGWNHRDLACVERFDPQAAKWTKLTSMKYPRSNAAVAEMRGKLYAMGGSYNNSADKASRNHLIKLSHVECYDIHKDQWTEIRAMTICRSKFKACAVQGKLFAIGGDKEGYVTEAKTVEVFDPEKDDWKIDETWSGMKIDCMTPITANVRF